MASSKRPRSASRPAAVHLALARALLDAKLRGKTVVVGLSGGVDSMVLLHALHALAPQAGIRLRALHVHHGLSPNAGRWAQFCRRECRGLGVPLAVRKAKVRKAGKGLEAAAREARYAVFAAARADVVALGHQLDDQAETVLLNLLRGAGPAGTRGMPALGRLGTVQIWRPLLEVPREAVLRHAREQGMPWMEDESNADEGLTRNFLRHRIGPLLGQKFPRWRESLARAARLSAARELDGSRLLREFLQGQGMRAPSEAKLIEMLRQLGRGAPGTLIEHEDKQLRVYRDKVFVAPRRRAPQRFAPVRWKGERRLPLPGLGGELRFRRAPQGGIDPARARGEAFQVRLRGGGERLQPDSRRPRRTLKNLFQEAAVPPWQRERLPLLFCGADLVWAPGLGVDARYQAQGRAGLVPEWRPIAS